MRATEPWTLSKTKLFQYLSYRWISLTSMKTKIATIPKSKWLDYLLPQLLFNFQWLCLLDDSSDSGTR